jgi:hypothetical protein
VIGFSAHNCHLIIHKVRGIEQKKKKRKNSSVSLDTTPYSSMEKNRSFGGTNRLHLQRLKNKPSKNPAWHM